MTSGVAQFHENEQLLAWVQTTPGRLALWFAAVTLLIWHDGSPLVPAAFTLVLLYPHRRRLLLSIAAAGVLADRFIDVPDLPANAALLLPWLRSALSAPDTLTWLAIPVGIGALYLAYVAAKQVHAWPAVLRRHPVLALHAAIWAAMSLAALPWLRPLSMLPFLTWRLSYLADSAARGKASGTRFTDHLFYLLPVYGGTSTPYGKGLDYLSRHEAGDSAAIARSQLAGIKLLLLAVAWICAYRALNIVAFGATANGLPGWLGRWPAAWTFDWPSFHELLRTGARPAWYAGWLAIYLELIRSTLALAAAGHVIVGCLRLFGFNVFRNTYKPLLSQSIVEFWNRYYYYFKELLVEFFFYPVYLQLRGLRPAARMFAAVFAAAFVGNMYYHLLAQPQLALRLDMTGLWEQWSPRLVYCFLLATGIWVSMLREQRIRAAGETPGPWRSLRRIAGVWTFYSIIQIWNVRMEGVGIGESTAFFAALFGIR